MTGTSLDAVNAALSRMRAAAGPARTLRAGTEGARTDKTGTDLEAGLSLHADPALGLAGTARSPEGWLLELDLRPAGPGGFCGLHLDLPALDLAGCAALGFTARGAATSRAVVTAALRSGHDGEEDGDHGAGFTDTFFDRHLLLRPEEMAHVDALPLPLRPGVPARAPWRQLVLFLPPEPLGLTLIDLRIFAV